MYNNKINVCFHATCPLGIEAEHWSTLLDFVYSGELKLDANNCFTLQYTADQLGMDEAVQLCEQYIAEQGLQDHVRKIYFTLVSHSVNAFFLFDVM